MNAKTRYAQGGLTLLEVLVALVIIVIGLLGLMGLQMRSYQLELESYQRSQALVLLEDMAQRIQANRNGVLAKPAAYDYVATDIGTGGVQTCSPLSATPTSKQRADYDLCQWGNLLRGTAETSGGTNIGAMQSARGCITNPSANVYTIAVVWLGIAKSGAPNTACGQGKYPDETLRRAVTLTVRIGDLTA